MSKLIERLSVFFPAYNEEGNIRKTVTSAAKTLESVADKWEIIIVDDGSSDRTLEIAQELVGGDKRIRVVSHKQNLGYGAALKTGFETAKYPWVAFTDSDGQFDFSEIQKFIAKKDEADLILGYRKKRADSFLRKLYTFGWASLARIILGLKAKDYSSGFKMIKKSVYEKIQPLVGEEKVTQIEMLVKARRKGFKFAEVGVSHFPRTSGKQTGAKLSVVVKSIFDLFKLWGKINKVSKKELIILFAILAVGAFLRLYKIDQYMNFLGDEGRDAIIVRRIFAEGHPPLIGPGTSVGNMYLGPIYYYMMALPLLLANYSPVGPAIMIAVLGIITIAFVWLVGRSWFGRMGGIVASALYAISPTVVFYSMSSWNPNIMPFFALLCIYSIWKVWKWKQFGWLMITGISLAFVLQSHYLGLFLVPTLFIFWLISKIPFRYTLRGVILFLVLMSPLVVFDLRHNWQNFNAIRDFAFHGSGSFGGVATGVKNFVPVLTNLVTRLPAGRNEIAGIITTIVLVLGTTYLLLKKKLNPLLGTWFILGVIGLSLYKSNVLDHYMGFLFPVPFLLLGAIGREFWISKYKTLKIVFVLLFASLVFVNLSNSHLRNEPNRQLQTTKEVAALIRDKANGQRFNLATIIDRSNRDPYNYFLLVWRAKVVDVDPNAAAYTITDQLFVICGKPKDQCNPLTDSSTWITTFGFSKIDASWEVRGINIYKLSHR